MSSNKSDNVKVNQTADLLDYVEIDPKKTDSSVDQANVVISKKTANSNIDVNTTLAASNEATTGNLTVNTDTKVNINVSKATKTCPFADPNHPAPYSITTPCPFHRTVHKKASPATIKTTIPFKLSSDGDFRKSGSTAQLLRDVGGGDVLRQMCTRFYARAFRDATLAPFMFHADGVAAHGQRLGDWLVEKMGGEGDTWTRSGREGMRSVSHSMAWHSHNRPAKDRGSRFKLDDCRVWLRLMFWAGRDVGLDGHEAFWGWWVGFLAHFIAVYERSASAYAKESAEWSKRKDTMDRYERDGFAMKDVIGIGRY